MAYGSIKVDNIIFTNGGADETTTVSGIYKAITSGVTVSGTISGTTIQGQTISGVTVTGTTIQGASGTFTSLTGITTTGTTANFVTHNGASGVFTTLLSGATVTGTTAQFTNITGGGIGATTITGTTVTGTTANFVSGVFTTQISGATVTGTTANFTSGNFTALSGASTTVTSGIFAVGSAAAPSISFTSDPNTGIYSPGADQVAISTNGSQRLSIGATGSVNIGSTIYVDAPNFRVGLGVVSPSEKLDVAGNINLPNVNSFIKGGGHNVIQVDATKTYVYGGTGGVQFRTADNTSALIDITNDGKLGLGTSTFSYLANKLVIDKGSTANDGITLVGGNTSNACIWFAKGTTGNEAYRGGIDYNFSTDKMQIYTGANGGVVIDSSGRLGIGTSSPNSVLQVNSGTNLGGILIGFNAGSSNFYDADLQVFRSGNGTERARIDSSGRLLVGTSSAYAAVSGVTPFFQLQGTGENAYASIARWAANTANGGLIFNKSRGASVGTRGVVAASDGLGEIAFAGDDGTNFIAGARIEGLVDGTPGTNDMPGRLVFSTTADGASSPTERIRIRQSGQTSINNSTAFYPDANNATALGDPSNRWTAVYAVNGTIQTSDGRQKTNIVDAQLGSDFVKSLRPVSYQWIEGGKRHTGEYDEDNNWVYETVPGQRTHWGFIAQEVKQVVDAAGVDFGGWVLTDKDDPESQQALRYDQFIAPLTKALQEALAKIETLEARLSALEAV
jgi:hypothetical protein